VPGEEYFDGRSLRRDHGTGELPESENKLKFSVFPNPFNPITRVSFELATGAHVSVDVYDLRGRHIRSLAAEQMTAGIHELEWNGRDTNNSPASAGSFVVRMRIGNITESRLVALIK